MTAVTVTLVTFMPALFGRTRIIQAEGCEVMGLGDGPSIHLGDNRCNPGRFGENPEEFIQLLLTDQIQQVNGMVHVNAFL